MSQHCTLTVRYHVQLKLGDIGRFVQFLAFVSSSITVLYIADLKCTSVTGDVDSVSSLEVHLAAVYAKRARRTGCVEIPRDRLD